MLPGDSCGFIEPVSTTKLFPEKINAKFINTKTYKVEIKIFIAFIISPVSCARVSLAQLNLKYYRFTNLTNRHLVIRKLLCPV